MREHQINIKLTQEIKDKLEKASKTLDIPVSIFIRTSALKEAKKVLKEEDNESNN